MTDAPETIGRYQVRRIIGQGGMGMVLLAWDPLLDREVAIKLLREDDDELRERFAREARSAAKLRHPNVVTIFDVGEHDGRPFIAMEYIEGETLAAIIRDRKPVPTPKRLQYIEGLCDGLSFAHRLGIVHRDVKPANVMVERDGSVKILDFGIARASESVRLTRAGMLIGTLNYMSPEQVMGKSVDHRSDIFAVGLVFYELLAYQKAFPGKVLADLIDKIVKSAPPPLAELRVGLDPEVIHIVEKAMEKDPAARYQDLGSMQKDLERVRRRLETADEPTQPMRVPVEFLKPPSQQKADQAAKETAWQKAEAERLAEERRKEEERKKAEAARRAEAERLAEERRKEEERKKAEAARRAEAERLAEERRKEEEQKKAEAARRAEAERLAEERRKEEERKKAEAARRAEAERLAEERRKEEEQKKAEAARRAEAERLAEERRKEEERKKAEAARRAEAERLAEERRKEEERQAEIRREEAAARAKRIAEGVAEARAAMGREEFDAAATSLDALERADGAAPEIAEAREEVRAARAAAEAARVRAAVEAELARGRAALTAEDFATAEAAAAAAVKLDGRHEEARAFQRAVTDAIRADAERRAEAERAARAKRIAEGVAEARAAMGREEFDAAATSLDALERADGAAPEIAEAREEVRAARAAAEAARVRAAVEAELARGRAALTAGDFATAEAAAAAAVKLDGRHAEAQAFQRAVKDAIRREEAQRKAAEKEARRKQKEIASLLKKGTRTRSHAEAIASLERLLKLEPENKDAERLLENRRQALKDVEAEAARRVAQGLPPVPPSQAQVLLAKAATGVRGAAGSLQRFAQGSLRPAVANVGRKVASWRAPQWGIAGAAAVILLAAALWFSRSVEPPSVESALPPLQPLSAVPGALTGVPIPLPAPGGEPETVRAQSDAETAGAAREQAGEPQLPTEIPASQVALAAAARWEAMLQEATSLYDDGDRAGALETAGAILAESPRYQPLFELLGRMQRDGYDETRQARLAADAFGERVEKLQSYYDGAVAEDLASQANRSGEFFEAIRQYWRATDAFERATDEARKLPPEPTVDLEPVMAVVREYGRALQQLDANAVQRVFPDVDMRALRDEFRGIVTQQVTIRDPRAVAVADTSVAIRCEITRVVRRRNTSVEEITAPVELNLALRDGRWVIVARR